MNESIHTLNQDSAEIEKFSPRALCLRGSVGHFEG